MTHIKLLNILRGVRCVKLSVESDEAVVMEVTELSDGQEELATFST